MSVIDEESSLFYPRMLVAAMLQYVNVIKYDTQPDKHQLNKRQAPCTAGFQLKDRGALGHTHA
jgi:hypothetical protein